MGRWGAGLTAALVGVFAVGLSWVCVSRTVSQVWTEADPAAALRWDPGNARALSLRAWRRLIGDRTAADHAAASADARRALRLAPLDTVALRVLGLEADRLGGPDRARALLRIAGARSLRDPVIQGWLLGDALRRGDFADAAFREDVILRQGDRLENVLLPVMIASLRDPRAIDPMARRLADGPFWRTSFLSVATKQSADPAPVQALFEALARSKAPPTDPEAAALVARLIAGDDYRAARAVWARLGGPYASAAGGGLYDGAFRGLPGAEPFNWRLTVGEGAVTELARQDDGQPALHAVAPAVRETTLAEQLLLLAPGSYQLAGEALVDGDGAGDRFSWRLTCLADDAHALAETRQAIGPRGWHAFVTGLEVPPTGCDVQRLRLIGLAHDGFAATEAWYRKVSLIAATPAAVRQDVKRSG